MSRGLQGAGGTPLDPAMGRGQGSGAGGLRPAGHGVCRSFPGCGSRPTPDSTCWRRGPGPAALSPGPGPAWPHPGPRGQRPKCGRDAPLHTPWGDTPKPRFLGRLSPRVQPPGRRGGVHGAGDLLAGCVQGQPRPRTLHSAHPADPLPSSPSHVGVPSSLVLESGWRVPWMCFGGLRTPGAGLGGGNQVWRGLAGSPGRFRSWSLPVTDSLCFPAAELGLQVQGEREVTTSHPPNPRASWTSPPIAHLKGA